MFMTNILTALVLFLLAYLIKTFKLSGLIAGYNTASAEEKAKYDEEALIQYMSKLLSISGGIITIGAIGALIPGIGFVVFSASWVAFTGYVIGSVIYLNVSKCCYKRHD